MHELPDAGVGLEDGGGATGGGISGWSRQAELLAAAGRFEAVGHDASFNVAPAGLVELLQQAAGVGQQLERVGGGTGGYLGQV